MNKRKAMAQRRQRRHATRRAKARRAAVAQSRVNARGDNDATRHIPFTREARRAGHRQNGFSGYVRSQSTVLDSH